VVADRGPLRVCRRNPRYFAHADDEPVYLTGSHTWNNLVDMGPRGAVVPFDWDAYLDLLVAYDHSLIRLWAFDSLATWNPRDEVLVTPWVREGPGLAADGGPRLDLERPDPDYLDRVRARVVAARARGIYVSVMLFECWTSFSQNEAPLESHIFAGGNNINGVDILAQPYHGVPAGWSTLADDRVLAIQESYVREVTSALVDLDNVLYEIANEGGVQSIAWQEHLAGVVRSVDAAHGTRHPVGITGGMEMPNRILHDSSADWVAPSGPAQEMDAMGYRTGHYTFGSGPSDRGDRPIILDTDHLWGVGGDVPWVWKSFCRGYNVLYMDRWDDQPSGFFVHPRWSARADVAIRRELGVTRRLSRRLDLAASRPEPGRASTGYCIGVEGRHWIAFQPASGPLTLELGAGRWSVTWHDPTTGVTSAPTMVLVRRPGTAELVAPFEGPSVVLVERPPDAVP
jgi:hypothetical protein